MLTNATIKEIKALHKKNFRQEKGLFIAEGDKICREMLQSKYSIVGIYALESWLKENENLLSNHKNTSITEKELSRISTLKTPNKVLIVAEKTFTQTSDIALKGNITLVLDNIQDAGNLGTIIRTADWFGVNNIICSPDTVELHNPKVIQSTMGSFMRINVIHAELGKYFKEIISPTNISVYGAMLNGEKLPEVTPPKECVIIIGNESKGISKELIPHITNKITIPAYFSNYNETKAESLNAAVATSILLSWFRMRTV